MTSLDTGARGAGFRQPCRSCPWRVDQDATAIPNFSLAKAEALAETCPDDAGYGPDFGAPQFACHQSRDGAEIVCAGWLATNGGRHPAVRMQVFAGKVPPAALEPGEDWPLLHERFDEVIAKLRATAPEPFR